MTDDVNSEILGKILLLQSTIHVLNDDAAIARFVCKGLSVIPGIKFMGMCIKGKLISEQEISSDMLEAFEQSVRNTIDLKESLAVFKELLVNSRKPSTIECLKISSIFKLYGYLIIDTADDKLYSPYKPYIENTLNLIALVIENLMQKDELLQHKTNLEKTVQERTEALKQTQAYLRNIIDLMPSILLVVDYDLNVTLWNREAEKFTNMISFEAIGQSLESIFPLLKKRIKNIQESIIKGKIQNLRKIIHYFDGKTFYFNILVFPLIIDDIEGAVIRIDNVTEQVTFENTMIQTEKMMSIGGLAAGMAHEINNPLGGILQSVQNIQRRLSYELVNNIETAEELGIKLALIRRYLEKRDILKFLDGIQKLGIRASNIVANMLQFSRQSQYHKEYVHIADIINSTLELAANDYNLKKHYDFRYIKIEKNFDLQLKKIPLVVTEIEQVILNLLKNAAQAMVSQNSNNSPIINLRTRLDENMVRIEVEDNGPGMEENVRKRVFEPFYTTKQVGKGTGLGLSVSYTIITNNHNGSIEVESIPGKGSKFIIKLPVK